jgi:hypothetical protein
VQADPNAATPSIEPTVDKSIKTTFSNSNTANSTSSINNVDDKVSTLPDTVKVASTSDERARLVEAYEAWDAVCILYPISCFISFDNPPTSAKPCDTHNHLGPTEEAWRSG